jgi:hypothetical protein
MIKLRPATRQDFIDFSGRPPSSTMKVWVIDRDGDILGMGGLCFFESKCVAFSDIKEGVPKKSVLRCALKVKEMIKEYGQEVWAIRDKKRETSKRFLEYLGFEHFGGDIWLIQSR